MNKKLISLLGGTGDLGTGLATRLLKAGYTVIIGSRTLEKAQQAERSLGKNTKGLLNSKEYEVHCFQIQNARGEIKHSQKKYYRCICQIQKPS